MLISISLIISFLMGTLAVFQVYFMLSNVTMSKIIDQFRVIHRSEENEISSGSKNKKPLFKRPRLQPLSILGC